jgi:gas vesicle protein
VGGVFGIVAGILIAPYSGAEARRRLAATARHAAEVARDVADRAEVTAGALGDRVEHYLGHDEELAWRKVREIREGVDRYTQAQVL